MKVLELIEQLLRVGGTDLNVIVLTPEGVLLPSYRHLAKVMVRQHQNPDDAEDFRQSVMLIPGDVAE